MILGYHDRDTRAFAAGDDIRRFRGFADAARRRLRILDAATTVGDLCALPSNRFEALRGDRSVQCSIRINLQWRLCFVWPPESPGPERVEIVDYH